MTNQLDQILGMLFVSGLLAGGGFKALHTAWVVRYTSPMFRKHITQRTRYLMILTALLLSAPTLYVFARFGMHQTLAALAALRAAAAIFGWAMTLLVWLGLLTPVLAVMTIVRVYIAPAPYARRVGKNLYLRISDSRSRNKTPELARW
ncbi:MAG: hypothetical protein ACQR33_04630 [Candidatus Saccharibacteria bacterium]